MMAAVYLDCFGCGRLLFKPCSAIFVPELFDSVKPELLTII